MPSSMQELERAVVQLIESERLAEHADVAHDRLALLLLDNAAETALVRSTKRALMFAEWYEVLSWRLRDVAPDDEEGQQLKAEFDTKTLSRRRRRQIDRNFDELVDYVFEQDDYPLEPAFAECLKILHRYRNDAYHRDTVRPDVLRPAVQIYFFLCCHLLKSERHMMDQLDVAPPAVAELLGPDGTLAANTPLGFGSATGLAQAVADHFLASRGLDHGGVASALSDHLVGRLNSIEKDLHTIAANCGPRTLSRQGVLQLIQQLPRELEDFDQEQPVDFWTRPVAVTDDLLDRWGHDASDLAAGRDAVQALRRFAAIERPLAKLEEPVGRYLDDLERLEQQALDQLRGK